MAKCTNCGQYVAGKGGFGNHDVFNRSFCCGDCKRQYYENHQIQGCFAKIGGTIVIIFLAGALFNAWREDNQASNSPAASSQQSLPQEVADEAKRAVAKLLEPSGKSEGKAIPPPVAHGNTQDHSLQELSPDQAPYSDHKAARSTPKEKYVTPPQTNQRTTTKEDLTLQLSELKGELAALNAEIEMERARWKAALHTINQLTNNKRTAVVEGSQAYYQCMAASKIINEVETKAPAMNAKRARLDAMIKELDK